MANRTGVDLLAALRKTGSFTLLREIPEDYFLEGDERDAFTWLKDYVSEYHAFPQPTTFKRETGITLYRTNEPVDYYINRAKDRCLYNLLHGYLSPIQEAMKDKRPNDVVELAKQIIASSHNIDPRSTGISSLVSSLDKVEADIEVAKWCGLRGITTGWPRIDDVTNGWQDGDLVTLVGRPGTGKTYVLLKTAHAAWAAGRSVLFVSMEMTDLQIARRLYGIHSGINPRVVAQGFSTDFKPTASTYFDEMRDTGVPFNIIAGNFKKSVDIVKANIEEHMPDLICVDASYLLSPVKKRAGSGGRRESVSDVIEELGALAKSANRPIVNTVQFNRTAIRKPRNPNETNIGSPIAHLGLHNIGETDVVGQVSSLVIGIEKAEPPHDTDRRYLGFLKGREGEQGHWLINYKFNPVDLSLIPIDQNTTNNVRRRRRNPTAQINLNFQG